MHTRAERFFFFTELDETANARQRRRAFFFTDESPRRTNRAEDFTSLYTAPCKSIHTPDRLSLGAELHVVPFDSFILILTLKRKLGFYKVTLDLWWEILASKNKRPLPVVIR